MSFSSACFIVVGDQGVGKTTLCRQFTENPHQVFSPAIEIAPGNLVRFHLIEDAKGFWFFMSSIRGCLLVFDLTSNTSFERLSTWAEKIDQPDKPRRVKVLVGNKCDLQSDRAISRQAAEEFATSHDMLYVETTAVDLDSARVPFQLLCQLQFDARPGMTAVHRAAAAGDVAAITQAFAQSPSTIDTPDGVGGTTFHYAAKCGRVGVIEELVRLGSQAIDTPDESGWTPLMTAVDFSQVEVVEALVRLGSQALDAPGSEGETPFHLAMDQAHIPMIETLVRLGSQAIDAPTIEGCTPCYLAAASGSVEVLGALVRLGSQALDTADHKGRTPMHLAAKFGETEAIKALVRLGSTTIDRLDNSGRTPLHMAAKTGRPMAIQTLVQLGSTAIDTPNHKGRTPLHSAVSTFAEHTVEETIGTLVRMGSKAIDALDNDGHAPMFYAIKHTRSKAIEALVCFGSRISDIDPNSHSPQLFFDNNCIVALKALGFVLDLDRRFDIAEEEVAQVRYHVYFSRSLVDQLLCALL